MNPIALIFFLVSALALLSVPRKWAPVALLTGCTYMTLGQGIELGPISLPIYRMMLFVGLVRVVARGERLFGGVNRVDWMMIGWGAWTVFASFFHDPERAGPVTASGAVYNLTLIYFLLRAWCGDMEEVIGMIRMLAILLVPVALAMIFEKLTGKNLFSVFGGVPENSLVREGKLRAQGSFRHPILAGTVGATCIPLFIGIYKRHPKEALIGIAAGLVMTFASASSGPVMSLIAGAVAIVFWRFRHLTKRFLLLGAGAYLVLMVLMEKPPYYLISRIDISGGSTGWHRAFLIDRTFQHLSEWWLIGTDVTRHWMPNQGIANDPQHTDITNYYIGFGVQGGVISMGLIIGMLVTCFIWVGKVRAVVEQTLPDQAFTVWCFGACLLAHAATSISVSYFDQSMLFFWLAIAVISSVHSGLIAAGLPIAASDHSIDVWEDAEELEHAARVSNAEWRRKLRERLAEQNFGPPPEPRERGGQL